MHAFHLYCLLFDLLPTVVPLLPRAPQTWKRPDEFDVERWRPGGPVPSELTENFAYLPFGGGRRKCIGWASDSLLCLL